jgi:hypothetical protein
MAYLQQEDPELIHDILQRKEFAWVKRWNAEKHDFADIIPRFLLEDAINRSGNLRLTSYQKFTANYLNPNTPYKRLLIKWQTGTGKSIGALTIAMNFINTYKFESEIGLQSIGTVFIIGFSERVFKNELLRFPEFGFLSLEERKQLEKLKRIAAQGTKLEMDAYKELVSRIKKRFSNRKGNGFFKFYGYKAFVNRIFQSSENINISTMSEAEIRQALQEKRIEYNLELLNTFKNSLIICDEIHNVYNSIEKNNWGIAIQAVLDHEPTCRAVFTSATPINNKPTEIIDLLNLLLPPDQRLKKVDFFLNDKDLKPGALERIADLANGRISYLRDVNPKYYPRISMKGDKIPGISYLKFIRCPMTPLQYSTYKEIYKGSLSQDSQYLMDFILPNFDNPKIGLYQTSTVKASIQNATQKWRDKFGIDYRDSKIIGDILKKENLKNYSSKYVAMLDELDDVISKQTGKVFIYHNVVHMSGVLLIEQILLKNGYIDENGSTNENTKCMLCGKPRKLHNKDQIYGGSVDVDITTNTPLTKLETEEMTITMVGGKAQTKYKEEYIEKKDKVYWKINGKEYAIAHRVPDGYIVPSADVDYSIYKGKDELFVAKFLDFCDTLVQNGNIYIEIPHFAYQLGNLLLYEGYTLHKQTEKYSLLRFEKSNSVPFKPSEEIKSNVSKKEIIHDPLLEFIESYAKKKVTEEVEIPKHSKIVSDVVDPQRKAEVQTFIKTVERSKVGGGKVPITKYVKPTTHLFTPARFIIVHSEVDKNTMEHSIERFNSVENTEGTRYMILVGSKIMKESYDIKAIQNLFVMSKPDNIATLLQIRGRAIRKNSHKHLPKDKRQVNFKIFVTKLPNTSKLSYEEQKYKEKVESFKIMQKIEKTLHENAIDATINKDIIGRPVEGEPDTLEALTFEPVIKKIGSKITDKTFNIYYVEEEVKILKSMIKRFFIEYSNVWEYKDLLKIIREDPLSYEPDLNTHLISEESFLIAINQLTWNNDNKYVEPVISKNITLDEEILGSSENNKVRDIEDPEAWLPLSTVVGGDIDSAVVGGDIDSAVVGGDIDSAVVGGTIKTKSEDLNYVVERIYDNSDKVIIVPDGHASIIVPVYKGTNQYYIMFPLDEQQNQPIIDMELPYRIMYEKVNDVINMNSFVQNKRIDFDYDDKKKIFYRKYLDISIDNMENVVCEYGTNFHIKFIEECIEYVFKVWTDPNTELHEYHEFYFKMLYYYDLLSLIMWAHTTKPRIFEQYKKYATPVKAKDIKLQTLHRYESRAEELVDISPPDNSELATSGIINLLKTTLNRTSNAWIPAEFRAEFDKTLNFSYEQFNGRKKAKKAITKVSGSMLPIGHYIGKFPRMYHPEKDWVEDPTYIQWDSKYTENDTIIGYDEKSRTGVHVRFKIRNPIQSIKKHKDNRLIEKGTVCKSRSKPYLRQIAKKLDIILPEKFNVEELCSLIRSKIIRLELKERIAGGKKKYFYFHYEKQLPDY